MYTEIGSISDETVEALLALLPETKWQVFEGRPGQVHQMSAVGCVEEARQIPELIDRWPGEWKQAIFIKLKPGDHLFRHADTGYGYHIPIQTSPEALSLSFDDNGERTEHHLEVGKIYHTDRSIEHESFNAGTSDRTHFLLEF